jgi:hypothetical protein
MQERAVELAFSAGCALVGRLFVLADAGTHHLPEWDISYSSAFALLCPVLRITRIKIDSTGTT